VKVEKPGQFTSRVVVIVDAKVDQDIVETEIAASGAGDEECRRLPPAAIAACCFAGAERR
jgi:hypothetical protein